MTGPHFSLLGPMCADVPLGPAKQRAVLAMLL